MGHPAYLSYEEEKELVTFIVNCAKMGYGKTRGEVLQIVGQVMKNKGKVLSGKLPLKVGGHDL